MKKFQILSVKNSKDLSERSEITFAVSNIYRYSLIYKDKYLHGSTTVVLNGKRFVKVPVKLNFKSKNRTIYYLLVAVSKLKKYQNDRDNRGKKIKSLVLDEFLDDIPKIFYRKGVKFPRLEELSNNIILFKSLEMAILLVKNEMYLTHLLDEVKKSAHTTKNFSGVAYLTDYLELIEDHKEQLKTAHEGRIKPNPGITPAIHKNTGLDGVQYTSKQEVELLFNKAHRQTIRWQTVERNQENDNTPF